MTKSSNLLALLSLLFIFSCVMPMNTVPVSINNNQISSCIPTSVTTYTPSPTYTVNSISSPIFSTPDPTFVKTT
jgi:hypothetical protein